MSHVTMLTIIDRSDFDRIVHESVWINATEMHKAEPAIMADLKKERDPEWRDSLESSYKSYVVRTSAHQLEEEEIARNQRCDAQDYREEVLFYSVNMPGSNHAIVAQRMLAKDTAETRRRLFQLIDQKGA